MTTNTTNSYELRARELMLTNGDRLAFVALSIAADATGKCPACNATIKRYESQRVSHARLCTGLHTPSSPADRAWVTRRASSDPSASARKAWETRRTQAAYDAAQTEKCTKLAKALIRLAALVAEAQTLDPAGDKLADVLDTIDVDLRIVRKLHTALNRDDVYASDDEQPQPIVVEPVVEERREGVDRVSIKLGSRYFAIRKTQRGWHTFIGTRRIDANLTEAAARAWLDEQRALYGSK